MVNNDDAQRDSEILIEQLFDLIVREEVEGIGDPHERDSILSENTILWVIIKRKIIAILDSGGFYLGLGNELRPSGVDNGYDLIRYIKLLGLRKELLGDVICTISTSNCFKSLSNETDYLLETVESFIERM